MSTVVHELIREAQDAGIRLRLVDGAVKAVGPPDALPVYLPKLRAHRQELVAWLTQEPSIPEPPANPKNWRELARAYHAHHFKCPVCIASGQGYGLRCGAGAALWRDYQGYVKSSPAD